MSAAPENRRRSQRLFLQVSVVLEGERANKSAFSIEGHTVVLNAHGALVEVGASLNPGQRVILRNVRTQEIVASMVKLVTPGDSGKFNVALEFVDPNPGFWHISFPPEDWSANRPDGLKKP